MPRAAQELADVAVPLADAVSVDLPHGPRAGCGRTSALRRRRHAPFSPPVPAREPGSRSRLAAPVAVAVGDTALGVVTFVRFQRPDPFEIDDAVLAEELAAQAAVCIDNARRYTRERATALALQRSLLPQSLTAGSAVEVASPGTRPPVMVRPDRTALFPVLLAGPPLGIDALPFESAEIALPEGSLLALYTDGLIQGLPRARHRGRVVQTRR
ncbi:SpoIIE family protein phosphatase [Streptomyces sp. DASNCL29]|uniref:SpoIIE family protein phosphatase n=1 Tax=Streptomyces sp. DASNCL29 TaxID=2583819 RepID=UPI0023EF746C|nr:SpoIIE family protein phosphatase [Streptomyces sp. DASNCL29]